MNLPIYQIVPIKTNALEELDSLLFEGMNLTRPVAFDLKSLSPDDQREMIGLIENWFETHQASWRFPYPVYFIADFSEAIGHIPVVTSARELPKFFNQKDTKISVKESQVLDHNRLLQQEIKNTDAQKLKAAISEYGVQHKKIFFLAQEAKFYESLLSKLKKKVASNG